MQGIKEEGAFAEKIKVLIITCTVDVGGVDHQLIPLCRAVPEKLLRRSHLYGT